MRTSKSTIEARGGAPALAFALAAALAACGGGADPSDVLSGTWRPPEVNWGMYRNDVAVAANGDAFLWSSGDLLRWERATQTWSAKVQTPERDGVIAAHGEGNAIVAGSSQVDRSLTVRRFDSGAGWPGGWSAPELVAPPSTSYPGRLRLAATDDGSAALAWTYSVPSATTTTINLALFEPGQPARRMDLVVPALVGVDARLELALAELGGQLRVVAVWQLGTAGEDTAISAAVLTYDRATHQGAWAGPVTLTPSPTSLLQLRDLGIDRAGNASLLLATPTSLSLVRFDGQWRPPTTLTFQADSVMVDQPRLAVDPEGAVFVAWPECTQSCVNTATHHETSIRVARAYPTTWGEPAVLATDNTRTLLRPQIATEQGVAFVTWWVSLGNRTSMWSSELVGDTWTPGHALDDVASQIDPVDAAMRGGTGLVAWGRGISPPGNDLSLTTALYLVE